MNGHLADTVDAIGHLIDRIGKVGHDMGIGDLFRCVVGDPIPLDDAPGRTPPPNNLVDQDKLLGRAMVFGLECVEKHTRTDAFALVRATIPLGLVAAGYWLDNPVEKSPHHPSCASKTRSLA